MFLRKHWLEKQQMPTFSGNYHLFSRELGSRIKSQYFRQHTKVTYNHCSSLRGITLNRK